MAANGLASPPVTSGCEVAVLGDALLDVVVRLDAAVRADTDTYGRTWVGAGGQGANVAAWVVALGGRGLLVAATADDPAGGLVRSALERRGVEVVGPRHAAGTGTVVSISTPDGHRTMLTDRGVSTELHASDLDEAWFRSPRRLHVSGYALARRPACDAALRAAAMAAGRVSVDGASVAVIEQAGAERFRSLVAALRPEVLFASAAEADLLAPLDDLATSVVVTLGARGCLVNGTHHAAVRAQPVDATGAGDAFVAGWLVGGVELALQAGAGCVSVMGAMPGAGGAPPAGG